VIILTRLGNGMTIAVNPDLIERAEHTPDTVITLVDGHKLVVEEPLEVVVALVRSWRASVAAEALTLAQVAVDDAPHTNTLGRPLGSPEAAFNADQAARDNPLGRVLRLPSREV
jgi:flagellar protein FlbD